MKLNGFTLVELVVVIVVLAILAVVATPKFIGLSSEAKIEAINQIQASTKTANSLVYAKSQMPSLSSQAVSGRSDLLDIDVDGDGTIDTRLLRGYLDNTDIEKWLELDDIFVISIKGYISPTLAMMITATARSLTTNAISAINKPMKPVVRNTPLMKPVVNR